MDGPGRLCLWGFKLGKTRQTFEINSEGTDCFLFPEQSSRRQKKPPLICGHYTGRRNRRYEAMSIQIRACTNEDAPVLAEMIRSSFQDVAQRFGLTLHNAPRHPSNCTVDWIQKDVARGVVYFILEKDSRAAGCVALEPSNDEVCYLERLAVLPDQRRQGFGKALVYHVLSEAKRLGIRSVSLGMIADHDELKSWYRGLGFVEGETKAFAHLPFRVTFMACEVKKS